MLIAGGLLTIFFIPKDEKTTDETPKWDGVGILLFSSFITLWMVFLLSLESEFQVTTLLVAIILTVVFYLYEKRRKDPFINVNFFQKNLNVTLIYVQYVLSTVIFFAILLTFPTYIQTVLQASSRTAGLAMLSLSIFAMVMTPIATRWMEKAGFRVPLFISAIVGIIGVLLLLTIQQTSPLFWIALVLAIFGISNGVQNIGLQNLLFFFIDKSETGIAAGLLMTSRFIGNILASSLYGLAFATGMSDVNMKWLAIVLLIISIVLLPGMIYMTRHENKPVKEESQG